MRLINTENKFYIVTAKRGQLGRIFKTQKHAHAVIYIKTNQYLRKNMRPKTILMLDPEGHEWLLAEEMDGGLMGGRREEKDSLAPST